MPLPCVIFDIDGVLADNRHRLHYIQKTPENWDVFYKAMADDLPRSSMIRLVNSIRIVQQTVFLITGRSIEYEHITRAWLDRNTVGYDGLYQRPAKDHRPDHIIKFEILTKLRKVGYEPWLAVEDRPQVVEMWRREGIECLQTPCYEED